MSPEQVENATVGCMTTSPARFLQIRPVIDSIAPQVDHLFIYVDETTSGFPDITHLGNVTVLDGRDHIGDLSDSGKIYPIRFARDSIVLTLDDNFIFPPDYVATYQSLLQKFDGKCAVTAHGGIFPPKVDWYFERTHVIAPTEALATLQLCSLGGSGTFGFDQKTLQFDPVQSLPEIPVDLQLSIQTRLQGLPIWVVPRPGEWLQHLPGLPERAGLLDAPSHHTDFARRFDWSFDIYRNIANAAIAEAGLTPADLVLDPDLEQALSTGKPPRAWNTGSLGMTRRVDYMDGLLRQ